VFADSLKLRTLAAAGRPATGDASSGPRR